MLECLVKDTYNLGEWGFRGSFEHYWAGYLCWTRGCLWEGAYTWGESYKGVI